MQLIATLVFSVSLAASSDVESGEAIVSGPQAGERVTGFFDFGGVKCGGAKDRYAVGTNLRYY